MNITRLVQSITEQNRMDIFRSRAARLGRDEIMKRFNMLFIKFEAKNRIASL
ncbi:MAG: hypothetical protein PHT78_12585 [Desulfitobacteriaceae bacterium]|nr:hypothetical protein [Desulfitobacteriaceae bacterium]